MSFIFIILSFNEWQYLNTIPAVKNFRDEHVQLGGAWITVVEMEWDGVGEFTIRLYQSSY